jgi:hypothetical protein
MGGDSSNICLSMFQRLAKNLPATATEVPGNSP